MRHVIVCNRLKFTTSKQLLCLLAVLLGCFGLCLPHVCYAQSFRIQKVNFNGKPIDAVAGEVLVQLYPDSDTPELVKQISNIGQIIGGIAELHEYHLKLPDETTVENAIAVLTKLPGVYYAEPNGILQGASVPNDYFYTHNLLTGYPAQYGPKQVGAESAWSIWQPRTQTILAILDTGVDNTHPDLSSKILYMSGSIYGYNAITNPYSPTNTNPLPNPALDDFGHGTHVAGIAAAQTNNDTGYNSVTGKYKTGIAGIAGWNGTTGRTDASFIKIMPVKVLDNAFQGTFQQATDGIMWASDHGANVLNMSFGGYNPTMSEKTLLNTAVQHAWGQGCVLVAAAGNDGVSTLFYPAALSNVISVAASDSSDKLAGFSNYGSWVSVAAPGGQGADILHPVAAEEILSTVPTYNSPNFRVGTTSVYNTYYYYDWGTSMASPHVAGEAALIKAQNSNLTNTQISALLTGYTDPVTVYTSGNTIANGRVNIYKALRQVEGAQIAPDTNGDGYADLIYQYTSSAISGTSAGDIYTQPLSWSGTGYQTLTVGTGAKIGNANDTRTWNLVAQGDLNNDGQVDLLFQEPTTGAVKCWLMTGSTRYEVLLYSGGQPRARLVGVADLNRDGLLDLIYQYDATGTTDKGKVTYSLINLNSSSLPYTNGGGTLYNGSSTTFLNLVGIADVNDDTYPDLVFQNPSTGAVTDYLLSYNTTNGPYAYTTGTLASGSSNLVVVSVCDLTNTGYPGLLYKNTTAGSSVNAVTFQAYNSLGTTGSPLTLYAGGNANVNVVAVTDLNRDGSFDIVYQYANNSQVTCQLLTNGVVQTSPTIFSGYSGSGTAFTVAAPTTKP